MVLTTCVYLDNTIPDKIFHVFIFKLLFLEYLLVTRKSEKWYHLKIMISFDISDNMSH